MADASAFERWYKVFQAQGWPPIRGVLHAAGIAERTSILKTDRKFLLDHLYPKMTGALVIEEGLKDTDLDFFVCFSSAASVLSSPDLGAYAAANAFMDAFVANRWMRGLPGLSIGWGAWSEIGSAAGYFKEKSNGQLQVTGKITPEQGIALMERLWNINTHYVAVLPIDWASWKRQYPTAAKAPLFKKLLENSSALSDSAKGISRFDQAQLKGLDPLAQQLKIETWLSALVLEVLMLPEDFDLDSKQLLNHMGMDSLMAIEVRNHLKKSINVDIPIINMMEGMSISDLSKLIHEQIRIIPDSSASELEYIEGAI